MKQANKFTALVLSVAMLLQTGMPVFAVGGRDTTPKTITSFSPPEQEEYELTIGASQDEIDGLLEFFPKMLTAQLETEPQDIVIGESTDGDTMEEEPSFAENQPEEADWEQENGAGEEQLPPSEQENDTAEVQLPVSWESNRPLTTETAGQFFYTAVLAELEGYSLAEGVTMPVITVNVAEGNADRNLMQKADRNSGPTRTENLVLNQDTPETDKLEEEGWKWEPSDEGGILTLDHFYLQVNPEYGFQMPLRVECNVEIVLIGENTIEVGSMSPPNAMLTAGTYGNMEYDILFKEGEAGGKLNFICADSSLSSKPYGIAANRVTIESGELYSNTRFCDAGNDINLNGGSLVVENQSGRGLTSAEGNVNFNGTDVSIVVGGTKAQAVYVGGWGENSETQNAVHINAGKVSLRSEDDVAVQANTVKIDSTGSVDLYGHLYCVASTPKSGKTGTVEINGAEQGISMGQSEEGAQKYPLVVTQGDVNVQLADADYSKVDAAIQRAESLNKAQYEDFSGVEAAIAAVVRGKDITEQSKVDAMAQAIEDAIAALKNKSEENGKVEDESHPDSGYKPQGDNEEDDGDESSSVVSSHPSLNRRPANYNKVDAAIQKAKQLNKALYQDFSGVEAAVAVVVRGKKVSEQGKVNAMAKAIEAAIAALEYKPADYSKVDAAIQKAERLNQAQYEDFSGVEAAIAAVVREKKIIEQAEVDAMAQAIEDAIAALKYKTVEDRKGNPAIKSILAVSDLETKLADYSKVDAAIQKVESLNRDQYEDFSDVEAAVAAVVRDKQIGEQTEVDAMAQAIESALDELKPVEKDEKAVPANQELPEQKAPAKAEVDSPQTDSNSHIVWGLALLVGVAVVLSVVFFWQRRRRAKKDQ